MKDNEKKVVNQRIYIGKSLRKFRKAKAKDYSQERLAEDSNLSPRFINYLELNKRRASLDSIFAIARALGIKPSELVKEIEKDYDI